MVYSDLVAPNGTECTFLDIYPMTYVMTLNLISYLIYLHNTIILNMSIYYVFKGTDYTLHVLRQL